MKKIGFIGCGNMASAMIGGICKTELFAPEEIIASDLNNAARVNAKDKFGIEVTSDNKEAVKAAQLVVLSVKPQYYTQVIGEIAPLMSPDQIILTIAPGWTLQRLGETFGRALKIVRAMPNTPALVGEGITAVCANDRVTEEELEYVCSVLKSFGKAEVVAEHLMDAVVSVSGSSPAYVFMFIEAMADAAVADGMPRSQAYQFAAQAVYGSAKMVLDTGLHPGQLKDMVCSPGGTTIEAVRVLEEKGFRSSVIEAMRACTKKARGE